MVKCCSTCGHPIDVGDVTRCLAPLEAVIFRHVQRAGEDGISVGDLIAAVYSGVANGGPASARNVMSVIKHRMNRKLEPHALRIVNTMGHGSRYVLRKMGKPIE